MSENEIGNGEGKISRCLALIYHRSGLGNVIRSGGTHSFLDNQMKIIFGIINTVELEDFVHGLHREESSLYSRCHQQAPVFCCELIVDFSRPRKNLIQGVYISQD